MTMLDLDELERLERAASGGKWWADGSLLFVPNDPDDDQSGSRWIEVSGGDADAKEKQVYDDAEFIAEIRNNAAELMRLARVGMEAEGQK